MSDEQDPPLPVPGDVPEPGYRGGADFAMDFAEVHGLSTMLADATDYATKTGQFVRRYAELDAGEGWFNQLNGKHDAVVERAESWFEKLADPLLATTASKVATTIQRFENTEAANRATIDATVPNRIDTVDVSLPPWDKGKTYFEDTLHLGRFEYYEDPAEALHTPRDYEDDPGLTTQWKPWDLISPSGAARATVITVTDFLAWLGLLDRSYDPYDVFVKPIVGDWAGLRRYADVLRQAGDASERAGISIDRARHLLEPVWRGRSADACVVWLGAVTKPMCDAPNALDAMADAYERAAVGASQYRALLDAVIGEVIDAAFFVAGAVAIGGGGAAVTGGVSAGLATIVAGVEIYTIVDIIGDLLKAVGDLDLIVGGVEAAQNDFGSLQGGGQQLPNLPPVTGDASAINALPT